MVLLLSDVLWIVAWIAGRSNCTAGPGIPAGVARVLVEEVGHSTMQRQEYYGIVSCLDCKVWEELKLHAKQKASRGNPVDEVAT